MKNININLTQPNVENPILNAFAKYENQPSISRIKNYMGKFVDKPEISNQINKLDNKKERKKIIFL